MAEVHQLKPIENAAAVLCQQFADMVADYFNQYTEVYGEPPHSMAFVYIGEKGAQTGAFSTGPMEEMKEHVMCSAGHLLMQDSWGKK